MKGIYYPIAQHLQQFCAPDQFVIWRDAFRWRKHIPGAVHPVPYETYDEVLPNHYDSMELQHLADDFFYEIDWAYNLKHVAIVRQL
jgi:hypothetical protein